jgi:glycerophosphoryl diester phosphodiesterase
VLNPFFARRPLVFAHRGGSALAPENTLAAFDRGLSLGADGIELDVHLSQDGVVVVHHDRLLDRTTSLNGPVANRTAAELARADAAYRFDPGGDFPLRGSGVGIPTLVEVLTRYPAALVIVEMKVNSVRLADAVVEAVKWARAIDRVCLGSFGRQVLRRARTLEPTIATSAAREEVRWALYRSWCRWPVKRPAYDGFQVPERAGRTVVTSPQFVADAHRAGLGVHVWTVDTAEDATRLLDWGVDGLITDRPDVVAPIVKARRSG